MFLNMDHFNECKTDPRDGDFKDEETEAVVTYIA